MIPFNLFCKNLVTLLVIILCNEEKKWFIIDPILKKDASCSWEIQKKFLKVIYYSAKENNTWNVIWKNKSFKLFFIILKNVVCWVMIEVIPEASKAISDVLSLVLEPPPEFCQNITKLSAADKLNRKTDYELASKYRETLKKALEREIKGRSNVTTLKKPSWFIAVLEKISEISSKLFITPQKRSIHEMLFEKKNKSFITNYYFS